MASAKKAAPTKKPGTGTAVAPAKGTSVVSVKEMIAKELAEMNDKTGNPSGDSIRITQSKKFKLPDGTEHPGPLRMVIVDYVPGRFFYDRPYDPKNPTAPACFAITTTLKDMAPSKNSPDRQSDACTGCPNNEFGSAGDGKACKETRILAVIPEDADAETPLAVMQVSPTGLKAFDSYVRSVANSLQKVPFQVVTEVRFDENADYPSLRFGNPEPASEDLVQVAVGLKASARARLLVEPDATQYVPLKQAARGGKSARR